MPVKLTDKVYNEGGSPVQGAVAQAISTNGTTSNVVATDITDTKGIWAFDSAIAGHQPDLADPATGYWYDVRLNVGMQYRLRYGAIKAMMSMVYLAQNIVLGASQMLDVSLARLRLPIGTSDRTTPSTGEVMFRTDNKLLRIFDGATWLTAGGGETYMLSTATTYDVPDGVNTVFVSVNGATVRLPAAASSGSRAPVTISPGMTLSTSVSAVSGGVYGGSFNLTTGAVLNGQIVSSATVAESVTYKSDGSNWRAV